MQPGQQRHAHREHGYRNPELRVGQNCFQHLDKPNGIVRKLFKQERLVFLHSMIIRNLDAVVF